MAEKNKTLRGYGVRVLQVGGHQILTNLTEADLKNPRLWRLRTPEAWAQAIVSGTDAPGRRHIR
jgi:hypothetical protein